MKPDPITNLGIIVNAADRTVTFASYVVPVTGINATLVNFNGRQSSPLHRRARTTPLTNEEKRARVEAELKADPARSDGVIADASSVTQPFVHRVRQRLESQGAITVITPSDRTSRTGKVGEGQRAVSAPEPPAEESIIGKRRRIDAAIKDHPGKSNVQIAAMLGVHEDTVRRVRKRGNGAPGS